MTKITRNKLHPEDFTNHPEVQQCLSTLRAEFGDKYELLNVSDTLGATPGEDGVELQYVDLVQKGGGVLGVALVGYTYILEEAGIRFVSLAGTSAGAINTAMIAAVGKDKSDKKSLTIIKYLSELNFFDMVDGHPVARTIIKWFIKDKDFSKEVKTWIIGLLASFFGLLLLDVLFLGLTHVSIKWSVVARTSFVLTGVSMLLIICVAGYGNYLLTRLKTAGYGVNPGTFLLEWIKAKMQENDIHSIGDLENKVGTLPPMRKRHPDMETLSTLKGNVTFITAELVTQNKVEFPKMWNLFSQKGNGTTHIHPAFFVRASMSIPIFFEACVINGIDTGNEKVQQRWQETFGIEKDQIPVTAKFVDGG
ncbi:MAG TPA: patatin-like phospholipase family protein, partial [Flavipsychrobacter sp.]|nr:patatin-like phospholipase family protein [Flavipsychrobacter sp.]